MKSRWASSLFFTSMLCLSNQGWAACEAGQMTLTEGPLKFKVKKEGKIENIDIAKGSRVHVTAVSKDSIEVFTLKRGEDAKFVSGTTKIGVNKRLLQCQVAQE